MAYIIVWFRQDLRLIDNPAFYHACTYGNVIPLFIQDPQAPIGSASQWWLHHSLTHLSAQLKKMGLSLVIRKGNPLDIIKSIIKKLEENSDTTDISLYFNQSFVPYQRSIDKSIKTYLEKSKSDVDTDYASISVRVFNGSLLTNPSDIKNKQGKIFQIFTPYWRHCLTVINVPSKLLIPKLKEIKEDKTEEFEKNGTKQLASESIESLGLLPKLAWANGWEELWQPGEEGAQGALKHFFESGIRSYATGRDFPDMDVTSHLSPHLHFGEISPRQVWIAAKQYAMHSKDENNASKFLAELGWREFAHYMLFHQPELIEKPFKPAFLKFPWLKNDAYLKKWQKGQTGYPIVDAGMRELWSTGFMHNRVRMIVASFLTKHLMLPWQEGASWFLDTLVDADLANNTAGWQWVAGCGCDASPYFRIFNPVLQGEKFDAKGSYIKQWIPELKECPEKYIHAPWTCPPLILKESGIVMGKTYPNPMVDHNMARQRALEAYKLLS